MMTGRSEICCIKMLFYQPLMNNLFFIFIYICVCVCVCVNDQCNGGGGGSHKDFG